MAETSQVTEVLKIRRKALEQDIENVLTERGALEAQLQSRLDANMRREAEILAEVEQIENAINVLSPAPAEVNA